MVKLLVTAVLVCLGALTVPADQDATATAQVAPAAPALSPGSADAPAARPVAPPASGTEAGSVTTVFEITGSGKEYHFESKTVMKSKTFKTNVKAAAASACIVSGCFGLSPSDPGGKAYLFYDDQGTMRLATNTSGTGAVTLTGHVGADGFFVMSGVHAGSDTAIMMIGKVKWAKGTFTPTRIKAKFTTVSRGNAHSSEGKIKTVGGPVIL